MADFPGYEVSSLGRVRSLARTSADGRQLKGRLKKIKSRKGHYAGVGFSRGGYQHFVRLHVVVCRAFHGKAPRKDCHVDHIDEEKSNNTAANLQWLTPKRNLGKSAAKRNWSRRILLRGLAEKMDSGKFTRQMLEARGYTAADIQAAHKITDVSLGTRFPRETIGQAKGLVGAGIPAAAISRYLGINEGQLSRILRGNSRGDAGPIEPTDAEICAALRHTKHPLHYLATKKAPMKSPLVRIIFYKGGSVRVDLHSPEGKLRDRIEDALLVLRAAKDEVDGAAKEAEIHWAPTESRKKMLAQTRTVDSIASMLAELLKAERIGEGDDARLQEVAP